MVKRNYPSTIVRDGVDFIESLRWAADSLEHTGEVRTLAQMNRQEVKALERRYRCRVTGGKTRR